MLGAFLLFVRRAAFAFRRQTVRRAVVNIVEVHHCRLRFDSKLGSNGSARAGTARAIPSAAFSLRAAALSRLRNLWTPEILTMSPALSQMSTTPTVPQSAPVTPLPQIVPEQTGGPLHHHLSCHRFPSLFSG